MDAPPTRHVEIVAPAGFVPFERSRIEQSIVAAFEARVAQAPARPAVKTAAESLSYGELNAWANRIARGLLASRPHPAPGRAEPVALLFEQGMKDLTA